MGDKLNTCRLCTRQGGEMLPIFNPESLALKISWVSQLKFGVDDGLPGQICVQCNVCVDKAYQFKELCWTSDEELRRTHTTNTTPDRAGCDLDASEPKVKVKVEMREDDNVWSVDVDQLPEVVETETVETTPFDDFIATKTQAKLFHCDICEVTFKKKQAFVSHAKVHAIDRDYLSPDYENGYSPDYGVTTFSCAICGAIVKSRNAFISHVRFHERKHNDAPNINLNTVDSSYTCALCGSSLKVKQAFISHVKQFHDGKKEAVDERWALETFKCAICDAEYRSKPAFISHIRLHTVEKRYGCPGCDKRFTSQSDLTRHYRCHTGEKPFRCVVCGKWFARQDHLAKHGRTHTGYKPYSCGDCSAAFSEKKSLASHLRLHRATKSHAARR